MADVSLASIREMIDKAFGDISGSTVDFKLLQAILFILASRLKILKRRILIESNHPFQTSTTTLCVTEVKVHAKILKKKKKFAKNPDAAEDDLKDKTGRRVPRKTTKETSIHKKIERPLKKGDTQGHRASVTRESVESRGKKHASGKAAIEKSSPEKSTTSKIPIRKQPYKTTEKNVSADIRRKSDSERKTAKHGSRETGKYSEQQVGVQDLSGLSSTDTVVAIPSAKTKTATVHYGSSGSSSKELKGTVSVNVDLPDTDDYFRTSRLIAQLLEPAEDIHQENLLIVQRVSVQRNEDAESDSDYEERRAYPKSVVTKEQFDRLVKSILEVQQMYGNIEIPGITDNPEMMKILRKSAAYNEGTAGIQLSARLEMVEKSLQKLLGLLTILYDQMMQKRSEKAVEIVSVQTSEESKDSLTQALSPKSSDTSKKLASIPHRVPSTASEYSQRSVSKRALEAKPSVIQAKSQKTMMLEPDMSNYIKQEDLELATQEVYEDYLKSLTTTNIRLRASNDNTMKYLHNMDGEITKVLDHLDTRMTEIDEIVMDYAKQVSKIDTELSTQMTGYQDEMTKMQQDLEKALDSMAEAIANQSTDEEAVADINDKFNSFQEVIDAKRDEQRQQQEIQSYCSMDIQDLVDDLKNMEKTKCNRDEVEEALSGKVDIKTLNGFIILQQFGAVQGDIEKRIRLTYDKMNNTEHAWQRSISELAKQLKNKAEKSQLEALRTDINFNLQNMRSKLQIMMEILGDPKDYILAKNIFHKEPCLSCDHHGVAEPTLKPIIPARPVIRPTAFSQIRDHGFCYPGMPIPHPKDQRHHVATCPNYCGGPPDSLSHDYSNREFFHHRVIRDPATVAEAGIPTTTTYVQKQCVPCHDDPRYSDVTAITIMEEREHVDESEEAFVTKIPWDYPYQYERPST